MRFQDSNLVGTLAAVISTRWVISARRGLAYWPSPGGQRPLRFLDLFARGFLANSHATGRRVVEMERVPAHSNRSVNGAC